MKVKAYQSENEKKSAGLARDVSERLDTRHDTWMSFINSTSHFHYTILTSGLQFRTRKKWEKFDSTWHLCIGDIYM